MGDSSSQAITQLLRDASAGKQGAVDVLFPIAYAELRRLAASYLRPERTDHTLQSTALVHEAYLRLVDQKVSFQNRAHFVGIVTQTMPRILMDHAKCRAGSKRGDGEYTLQVDDGLREGKGRDSDRIVFKDALSGLEKIDPVRGRIVEMRFFGDLSNEEAAGGWSFSRNCSSTLGGGKSQTVPRDKKGDAQ